MKIGFVVNDIDTEQAQYTTNRLAMAAKEMGHEAWYMGIGDFAYEPDGSLSTKARAGHAKSYRSLERHMADVKKPDVEQLIGLLEPLPTAPPISHMAPALRPRSRASGAHLTRVAADDEARAAAHGS